MAELSIIASVIQIADVGLRLSIKLYTFGEIVSTADRSVISISKDVSLTSSVLKELGALLDKDSSSRIVSENAVQTADKVVKECLAVFEEIEAVLVKKMPNLRASAEEKRPKAVVLLERVKWTYLQPKLQLLRSNLDRLKSTLLLMLNVITYARQVAGRSEPPSVIENQRSLIEDLARSNQDYIRKFESLNLGIEDKPRTQERCLQKDESSKKTSRHLQERPQVDVHGTGSRKRREPQEVHAPHMSTGDIFLSTSTQKMPRELEIQDIEPQQETQENGLVEDELFSHLKHYLSLVSNLLDEVDEMKYDIRIDSRDRVKVEILQTYEREIKLLDTPDQHLWGLMAANPIAPLVDSLQKHLHRAQQQQSQPSIKHHQLEDKVRAANLQKIHVNNSNRAPAAPRTSHAPCSFGGQSPQGVPQIYGPTLNQVTQEKLVLPVTKKRRSNNVASPSTPAQVPIPAAANKLSPFGKIESPDEQRTPTTKSLEQETPGLAKPVYAPVKSPQFKKFGTRIARSRDDLGRPSPHANFMNNEPTPRSTPQVPNVMRPLPSQFSPDHRLEHDLRLEDFATHATHSALRDKERRSNGCLTCLVRRIRCDEGLPICQNCIQSGSRCEADGPLNAISFGATSGSRFYDLASPEEGYKSPYPLGQFQGASTGGPSKPSLARSTNSAEKTRYSHRLPGLQLPPSPPPPKLDTSFAQDWCQPQDALRHQEAGQVVIPASQGAPPQVREAQQDQAREFCFFPYGSHPTQLQQPFQPTHGTPPQLQLQLQLLAPQPQPPPQPNSSPSRKRKAPDAAPIAAMPPMPSTSLGEPNDGGHEVEEPNEASSSMPPPKKSRTNTPTIPAEEQRLKVMRDAGNSWGGIAKVTRQRQPSNKNGGEATLVSSRIAGNSASQESVSDSEAERRTMLNPTPCMIPCMIPCFELPTTIGLDSATAFHDHDLDNANRRRSVVDDLIELWTLLPV